MGKSSSDYDDFTPKEVFIINTLAGVIAVGLGLALVLQGLFWVISLFQK